MHTKNESKHSEMRPVRQNPIQRRVKLLKKLCIMTQYYITELNSSVNLPSNPRPTHNSNVVAEVEG